MVTLEQPVSADHLFRKINAEINFNFIRDHVAHLYCADNGYWADSGRPSLCVAV